METPMETVEPKKRRTNPETLITRRITDWLRKQPATWYFKIAGNTAAAAGFKVAQKRGVPDLYVVKAGKSYWFEVKTQTGVLSDVQKKVHTDMRAAGASVWTVRSLEEVQAVLAGNVIEVEYVAPPVTQAVTSKGKKKK